MFIAKRTYILNAYAEHGKAKQLDIILENVSYKTPRKKEVEEL